MAGAERFYIRTVETLVIAGLALMVGITFISTVLRMVASSGGLYWAEEITRYTSIWVVFLASGLTIRYGVHFRVDLLVARLPARMQAATAVIVCLLMLSFEAVLIYFGTVVAVSNMDQQSTSLEFPMGYAYAAIPVGGVLMMYETVRAFLATFRRGAAGAVPDGVAPVLVD
jgi:TRAP-type C4-dicarboxylate transport system permease small subunit